MGPGFESLRAHQKTHRVVGFLIPSGFAHHRCARRSRRTRDKSRLTRLERGNCLIPVWDISIQTVRIRKYLAIRRARAQPRCSVALRAPYESLRAHQKTHLMVGFSYLVDCSGRAARQDVAGAFKCRKVAGIGRLENRAPGTVLCFVPGGSFFIGN